MKSFSVLVKPASADCNMHCNYCFYLDRAALYPGCKRHRMSGEVLEILVRSYMATTQPQYVFAWQGGEPTLMGLDFYERVVSLQSKYGHQGASVANHLQTNGLLLDDKFAKFLAKFCFLVGVSLDGPARIHDLYRTSAKGDGSHTQVRKNIGRLIQNGVDVNILTLVNNASVNAAKEIYGYLRDEGFTYHQYIPCVEFTATGIRQPYSITGQQWGDFLCEIFDEWIKTDFLTISIRFFDSIIYRLVNGAPTVCQMDRNCCQYFVVEYNGDIYPCDFFVDIPSKLGNIHNQSWLSIQQSKKYKDFGASKAKWHSDCVNCQYLFLCAADCLKYRRSHNSRETILKSCLCDGYRQFYKHALPTFQNLAAQVQQEQIQATLSKKTSISSIKFKRNAPCPCGSQLKYKKCCGL
jgi:uncharacterized protein